MSGESPALGRASADALDVEEKSTGDGGQDVELTVKQRRRWSALTVEGILARDPTTAQAHDLAFALGKGMRHGGSFDDLGGSGELLCVEVRPVHQDKVLGLLGISAWSWGEYVRRWIEAGLAHRCADLRRGSVRLFLEPRSVCPVPSCGETVAGGNGERCSEQRSMLLGATENVLTAGNATGDEEGDARLPSEKEPSEEQALASLKRILGAEAIGAPLTDDEIRANGYEPTRRGWAPRKAANGAA